MLSDINKSKLSFEKYLEIKGKVIIKSYTEKFKWIRKFLYWFSWFGNGVSIFLAFFFIQAIFYSSFNEIGKSLIISLGIIFFLTMFELLKRYVFGMFCLEYIKQQFHFFRANMFSFILGTAIIVAGSFFMSLNGAKKFVDNEKIFTTQTEAKVTTKVDSLKNFYFVQYIKPLMEENKLLNNQNTDYSSQAAQTNYKSKYTGLIAVNNNKIEKNQKSITEYEKKRDDEIETYSSTEGNKLTNIVNENKYNIIAFIIISFFVELVIMIGIYYDKFYDYKLIKEYEETVVNTAEFKRWHKYNFLLEIIYNNVKDVGEQLPTVDGLIELAEASAVRITKPELDKFIKTLYYLEIVSLEGKRRILNVPSDEGKQKLREYFNIA